MSAKRVWDLIERVDPGYELLALRKRGGGVRDIHRPDDDLLALQRILLNRFDRHVPHPAAYAYRRGYSIVACAEHHLRASTVVRLDIHRFFNSVTERHVFNALAATEGRFRAALIARLCCVGASSAQSWQQRRTGEVVVRPGCDRESCECLVVEPRSKLFGHAPEGFLPQGAPTSGALSNLVMREFDVRAYEWASQRRIRYTRYSDDMHFSSTSVLTYAVVEELIRVVRTELAEMGMRLNDKKTRVARRGARRLVLGMLVDGPALRLTPDFRRRIDLHIRSVARFGPVSHSQHRGFETVDSMSRHVDGLLAHAYHVDPTWARQRTGEWQSACQRSRTTTALHAVRSEGYQP